MNTSDGGSGGGGGGGGVDNWGDDAGFDLISDGLFCWLN